MSIELDRTSKMILEALRADLAAEPPQDAGGHPSAELHSRVGAAWAEWEKRVSAWRLLLGVRLTNLALEQEPTE